MLFDATLQKKDLLLPANKLIEKKKKYLILRKCTEITYQLQALENANIVDIKSVFAEHPKTSNKLSKTKKVGSNSSSFKQEKCKIKTKQAHAFKGYASDNNVVISNSFNVELQLKDSESIIKVTNRIIDSIKRF